MKKKFLNILTLILIPVVTIGMYYVYQNKKPTTVRAFGVINVDFGVPDGDPIFEISGIMPGDCIERIVKVTNSGSSPALISVKSDDEEDSDNLSQVLSLDIKENSNSLYSNTLNQFFDDSTDPNGVPLSLVAVSADTEYKFRVCFVESADNEYQGDSVIFDLKFGQILPDIDLPSECEHLTGIISKKIEGTLGNDKIRGTHEPELIIGFGGDDKLDGNGGDDCIIGGEGKDKLDGGQGEDTVVGNSGIDTIDGGSGNDTIWGNEDDDKIEGGSGEDVIHGNSGQDKIDGESGNDTIFGDEGNDTLEGGSGNDFIFGGSGNDKIKGDAGNDTLDGQAESDTINGNTGTDKCINGEFLSSCEII